MNNLKNIRKNRGFSIKKLHELTGIPTRTIESWENETNQIKHYHRLKLLSDVLECSLDELMTKKEKCLYGGYCAILALIQEEKGVCITVYLYETDYDTLFHGVISRETALELLRYLEDHEDIQPFIENIQK